MIVVAAFQWPQSTVVLCLPPCWQSDSLFPYPLKMLRLAFALKSFCTQSPPLVSSQCQALRESPAQKKQQQWDWTFPQGRCMPVLGCLGVLALDRSCGTAAALACAMGLTSFYPSHRPHLVLVVVWWPRACRTLGRDNGSASWLG